MATKETRIVDKNGNEITLDKFASVAYQPSFGIFKILQMRNGIPAGLAAAEVLLRAYDDSFTCWMLARNIITMSEQEAIIFTLKQVTTNDTY